MPSLLGQFYTRIVGSQEDIASEGLTYILQRSVNARQALNSLLQLESGLVFNEIRYTVQSVGDNLERPDIAGFDNDGKEVILIEAKFWAALTDNQPVGYLNRLGSQTVMLFICPSLRERPVFNEIQMRLRKAEISFTSNPASHTFSVNRGRFILVKTWNQILNTIRSCLMQNNEQSLLSDIDQIIGFCESIDNNAFQPFRNDDFAPGTAKRINSMYNLADKVIDELKKQEFAETRYLNATPQRYGYTRYFKIENMGLAFEIRFDLWERIASTPFWLIIKDDTSNSKSWVQTAKAKSTLRDLAIQNSTLYFESSRREVHLPIFPLIGKTEDLVIDDLTNQVKSIAMRLAKT